ncbi:hypothetical protein Tco_1552323, partial [Tanacetum coccineum]
EEYDEEREREPRPVRIRKTTLVLRTGRPSEYRADDNRSQGANLPPLLAAHLGRSENGQPLQSSLASVHEGRQPSINTRGYLPPNGTDLLHNAQPFISNNLQPSNGPVHTHVIPYSQPNMGVTLGQPLNYPSHAQGGNLPFGGTSAYYLLWGICSADYYEQ